MSTSLSLIGLSTTRPRTLVEHNIDNLKFTTPSLAADDTVYLMRLQIVELHDYYVPDLHISRASTSSLPSIGPAWNEHARRCRGNGRHCSGNVALGRCTVLCPDSSSFDSATRQC